jgi:hypothetical protein
MLDAGCWMLDAGCWEGNINETIEDWHNVILNSQFSILHSFSE